jgi:thiosulfate reductase cytochrome b subunit
MEQTHFTEKDRQLLTLLEERQKETSKVIAQISEKLDDKYVTKDEFAPIQRLVYGGVGVVLLSVLTAVTYLVVQH